MSPKSLFHQIEEFVTAVVVDIAPNRGYYSKKKGQSPEKPASDPPKLSAVKEPPQPRMPAMTGASGSEVRCQDSVDTVGLISDIVAGLQISHYTCQ